VTNEAIGTLLYDRMVRVNRDVDSKEPAEREDRNQAESQTRKRLLLEDMASCRNILEGTAGSLVVSGLIAHVDKIAGLFR